MGSFANSAFSMLLGWIRAAVDWLWRFTGGAGEGGLIPWIGRHWLALTIVLCAVCMLVDALVHLARWQPHKVWASFFRRITGRQEQEAPVQVQRAWLYADGTARTEGAPPEAGDEPVETWYQPEAELPHPRTSAQDLPPRYVSAFARPEDSYRHVRRLRYQDDLDQAAPVQGLEDYPQPAPADTPANPADRRANTDRRKRAARLTRAQFTGDHDELEGLYHPVPPPVSKKEAYRQAFVPPQWRKPADVGASVSTEEMDDGYHGSF